MKLEIDRTGAGFKILGDDGADITEQLRVRAVTVECAVNQPTTAIMEVLVDSVTVVPDVVEYHAGPYGRIKGIILESGKLHYFPDFQRVTVNMYDDFCMVFAYLASGTHRDIDNAESILKNIFAKFYGAYHEQN